MSNTCENVTLRTLRLPNELHEQLRELAKAEGRSANNYMLNVLRKHVDQVQPPIRIERTVGAPE